MKIIKLNAIASTNDYLKTLSKVEILDNFTVVVADFQTNGRGQMYNKWHSKDGKNLLFSVLINNFSKIFTNPFRINALVSLAIFDVISSILPNIKIKWPNDIMSRNKKICGILTENTLINNRIKNTIVGIGLNVNQLIFPKKLTNVTSISKELDALIIDRDTLLIKIINQIIFRFSSVNENLNAEYLQNLYQFNKPAMYKNKNGRIFLGKIVGVTKQGKLELLLENDKIKTFNLKEIIYL